MKKGVFILIILFLISSFLVYTHSGEEAILEDENLSDYFRGTSVFYVLIGSIIVIFVTLFSIFHKEKSEKIKWFLFLIIAISAVIVTVYISATTIYLNVVSETKGPVHWHADFEIWNCGEKVDLVDPEGISNRVGNPVLHEHGDDRIHVEGVLLEKESVNLHNFFEIIMVSLTRNSLEVYTNHGMVQVQNGDLCDGEEGVLQVFVYKVTNPDNEKKWIFTQEKLNNFEDYILSPYSKVPPGDCIIIEFDREKNYTDKICETYKISMERGELSGS